MDTYRSLADVPAFDGSILTVGTYDGLHRGHLAVIRRVVERARQKNVPSVVITFNPHPQHILAKPGTPRKEIIVAIDKKLELMEQAGVDIAVVFSFDKDFSQVTAPEFLQEVIVGRFHPSVIVVGYDHHFGYDRQGNAPFLRDKASTYGYVVEEIEEVNSSEAAISSSRIRQLLKSGQCEAGARLLGRPYEIPGTIIKGSQRGKQLTYPTANLEPDESYQLIPKHGVYVISASIDDQDYFGVCNVGFRPTFGEKSFAIEAHFFDLPMDDIYHRKIALKFHHWIREEKKFKDASELRTQIEYDKETAQKWIVENQGGINLNATID